MKIEVDSYKTFLESKVKSHIDSGFYVELEQLPEKLFDFQKWIVQLALKKGRFAIFSDTGTGKTFMQVTWANEVVKNTNKPVLILCPLAVAGQTIKEGLKIGINVQKISSVVDYSVPGIYISNYEQLNNIGCSVFGGIVIDESSIIKSFTGKYRNQIIDLFSNTQYKLACTATPAPNDPMELGNHSEFLNQMSRDEMLSMFFTHDGSETSKWKIKGHAESDFWDYMSNFSVMLSKPSDIGFSAEGYNLPPLNIIEEKIETDKRDNGLLFNDVAVNATNFNQELRLTMEKRLNKVAEIVNNSKETFIIWIKQNEEGKYLKKLIPDAIEVKGDDNQEWKEDKLLGFADNQFRVLITKSKIAQFGLNFQNCHNQVFASLDFSFESTYQSIRRSYRFGQLKEVNIHLIITDTMSNVSQIITRKQEQFKNMQEQMSKSINNSFKRKEQYLNMEHDYNEFKGDNHILRNGDCIKLIKELEPASIDFSVFSPPFANLYTYSDHLSDMGNSKDYDEFVIHFGYLVTELERVMKSGRLVAVHCMDLPIQKGKEGFIGLRDFSGMIINAFTNNGFIYHDRITIWKDPVVEMQRTKALGLLHKQLKKDSSMSRTGLPDYLLLFRREGDNLEPIKNDKIPVELWQKYASPVWYDINQTKTLQYMTAREEKDQKHICPLQLDTIERAITMWSNPGDTVLTPFAGIGSELYQALKMDRKAIGFELKTSYFDLACRNIDRAVQEDKQLSLLEI